MHMLRSEQTGTGGVVMEDCPLVNRSRMKKRKEKMLTPKYAFAAVNIPGQPAQLKSLCGESHTKLPL